jgi:LacI family transcriptional regulator
MRQNLVDIAKLAGVSRSTVSRVINNDPRVSDRTRQRVLEVIERENFRPNLAARALVTRRSRTLSLVIPQQFAKIFVDPYFPILIQGILHEAARHDYAVTMWLGDSLEQPDEFCARVLNYGLSDGVLVASNIVDDPLIPRLYESDIPFVLVGRARYPQMYAVDVDNRANARLAVEHLYESGYRRIATVAGPQYMSAAQDRLDGYYEGLRRLGLPRDLSLVAEGDFDRASGHRAMQRLLPQMPDAVFAASDVMAAGVLDAIHEAGLRVPDDIAVVGHDDLPVAEQTNPPLTTVHQPVERLGSAAASLLIDRLHGAIDTPRQIKLETYLVVRGSSVPGRSDDIRKEVMRE